MKFVVCGRSSLEYADDSGLSDSESGSDDNSSTSEIACHEATEAVKGAEASESDTGDEDIQWIGAGKQLLFHRRQLFARVLIT